MIRPSSLNSDDGSNNRLYGKKLTRTSQNIQLSERLGEWIIWPHLDIHVLQILPSEVWPTHELSPELQKWYSNVCHLKEQSKVIKKVANNLFSWAQSLLNKAGLKIQIHNFLSYKTIASSNKKSFHNWMLPRVKWKIRWSPHWKENQEKCGCKFLADLIYFTIIIIFLIIIYDII